jgi:hypothetical protein
MMVGTTGELRRIRADFKLNYRKDKNLRLFDVEILIPPHEPDGHSLPERFFVIADTPENALAIIKAREGVEEAHIVRELNDEQKRAFRYLRSAEL